MGVVALHLSPPPCVPTSPFSLLYSRLAIMPLVYAWMVMTAQSLCLNARRTRYPLQRPWNPVIR